MPTTSRTIAAPARAVFASLIDPWTYEVWVRGAKRIRDVDPDWPAPGSRFHHSVGIGPLTTRDETRLVRAETDRLVELDIHLWPLGRARVLLELVPERGSTTVVMREQFEQGPGAWADNRLQQVVMRLRNDWSLDQLKRVVEQRHRMG